VTTAGAVVATFGLWSAVATIIARLPVIARTSTLSRVALSWSTSWALVGFVVMALGWLHLLYAGVFFAIGVVAVAFATVIWVRALARRPPPRRHASMIGLSRSDLAVAVVGLLAVAAAALGAVRRPLSTDEDAYTWAAPLGWAQAHHFVELPYRLSNGFNLAEYLSVPAATFPALVVARFVGIALLVGIGLSAAALAKTAGVRRGWWVGIAAASIPLAVIDATAVGSDLEPAAFLATAALAFLVLPGKYRIAFYVVLTAGAVQAKVIVAPVAVVMTAVLVLLFDGVRGHSAIRHALGYSAGVLGSLIIGFMHTLVLTGHLVANNVRTIYPSGSPALASGTTAGRIPNLYDILLLPVNPFITGIIGQHEPYGGRTGLAMLVGLPVVVFTIYRSRNLRSRMFGFFVLGASTYLIIAPVFIKTRFLLVSWIFFLVAVGAAGEQLTSRNARLRRIGLWVVPGILLVSVLDPVRALVRFA
jgi:hypothetical protein